MEYSFLIWCGSFRYVRFGCISRQSVHRNQTFGPVNALKQNHTYLMVQDQLGYSSDHVLQRHVAEASAVG